ncbi:MAG: PKD domain-containing protein [Bacteroidetes bacterium]|nr:PKD domain-containing protein [Bacteroidota bacterium]
MRIKLTILVSFIFLIHSYISGQPQTYTVNKASLSSDKYDEFSPVYYKNGIVFCTNRNKILFFNYSNSENKGQFKINYIDTIGNVKWRKSRLLSRNLKTKFNDGPVTFNSTGDTIYYSRNLKTDGKLRVLSGLRNKLGVFNAVFDGKRWIKIREFRFNNEWYNITTPFLAPDGTKLFFASDKPGGFGGSDLYYCQWKNDYWDNPVNLGHVINTKGNEAYPFINPAGELYFSSDGHPGIGGKDIFFSKYADTAWLVPVRLDSPINSKDDDFGIITDSTMSEGFFSSNRGKSIDIYHFKTIFPQIFYCENQRTNQYCFKFSDDGSIDIDTIKLQYEWDFGDGSKATGPEVEHCFPRPGNYSVKQNIIEKRTGRTFFTKLSNDLELRDVEQPYITCPDLAVTGDSINFDGLKSNLPGYEILTYSWDFGDGEKANGGAVSHSYKGQGEFIVKLGLTVKLESTRIIQKDGISRRITICKDSLEMLFFKTSMNGTNAELVEVSSYDHAVVKTTYSAAEELRKEAVFHVEILSSDNKLDLNSNIFKNVPKKYLVKEVYNPDSKTYSYIIDQQISLMATYTAYRELIGSGFKETRTKIKVLRDPAAKELNSLKKIFGVSTDSYFDANNLLTSTAYLFLDNLVRIMNKYPDSRLEIGVHTDNNGSTQNKLKISQRYVRTIVDYLTIRGIDSKRLIAKSFGGSRPIAPNFHENYRKLNRRVDFTITRE